MKFLEHLFLQNTSGGCFCTVGTTVFENIVVRNGKKRNHNKVSYNYLGYPTQADHNSRRSQYSLVTCNVWKPSAFIFPFLSKEQKSFKKYSIIQFICKIHTHMICVSMISSIM